MKNRKTMTRVVAGLLAVLMVLGVFVGVLSCLG